MGRIFEKRKTTMFARWDRVSKQFARISKEIMIAVKRSGPDPDANPPLRRAMLNARAANMPKDKVEHAIRKASGQDAVDYQEIVYEGFAPHGVAVLVEVATDNPTRTVANVRSHFKTHAGNMGNAGSVAFHFKRMGVFRLDATALETARIDPDALELELIDHGLEDLLASTGDKGEPQLVARCGITDLGRMQRALEERGIHPVSSASEFVPTNHVELSDEHAKDVLALVDAMEQDDDVQRVSHTLG